MNGTRKIGCVINVKRVNADERGTSVAQPLRGRAREKRMPFEILVCPPMLVPACSNDYSFSTNLSLCEEFFPDGSLPGRYAHDHRVEVCELFQWQLRQVQAVGVAMKRRVNVRSGVGDHLDFAD